VDKTCLSKVARPFLWLYAFIPYLILIIWCLYGVLVRRILGHWPVVYKDRVPLELKYLDGFVEYSFLVLFVSTILLLYFVLVSYLLSEGGQYKKYLSLSYWLSPEKDIEKCILVYAFGVGLFSFLCLVTPLGSTLNWYLD